MRRVDCLLYCHTLNVPIQFNLTIFNSFLLDPGVPGVRSMGPGLSNRPFADLLS